MKKHIKLPIMVVFAVFCFKYLYADSMRMDYCKDTEYYDMDAYNGFKMEYEVVSMTVNGVAKPDSAIKQTGRQIFCFGIASTDSTQFEYITSESGLCRFKKVE